MNEICYEKVMEQAGKNQVMVFVHSRKDTAARGPSPDPGAVGGLGLRGSWRCPDLGCTPP